MVCEKMLFLFLLGTFVTVLFCHFPFLGGVPSGPRSPRARASPRARRPARARGVFGLVGDLSQVHDRWTHAECFLDWSNAFDHVHYESIQVVLSGLGWPPSLRLPYLRLTNMLDDFVWMVTSTPPLCKRLCGPRGCF